MSAHEDTEKRSSAYTGGDESCRGRSAQQQGSPQKFETHQLYRHTILFCAYIPIKERLWNGFTFNFQVWGTEKEEIRGFN